MTEAALNQLDAFVTPGSLLKSGREALGMSEREAADRLNFMPNYVAILERDDYEALRSPAFARGYVKTYARLLELDEQRVLSLFDEIRASKPGKQAEKIRTKPLQLQRTGMGVITGLGVLLLLVVALWWWRADPEARPVATLEQPMQSSENGSPGNSPGLVE